MLNILFGALISIGFVPLGACSVVVNFIFGAALPVNNVFGRLWPLWPFTYNEGSVRVPTGLVEAPHRLHRLQNKKISRFECSNGLSSQGLLTNIKYIPTKGCKRHFSIRNAVGSTDWSACALGCLCVWLPVGRNHGSIGVRTWLSCVLPVVLMLNV
jgi:hypothetical protein